MKKKVLVIGASGLVGSRFCELASKNLDIVSPDEKGADITDPLSIEKAVVDSSADVVVNFAAYTNVDGAEAQKGDENGLVWKLNVEGAGNVAEACKKAGKFLVHVSTDFVFPGNEKYPGPYSEDSKLPMSMDDGVGWYGWTKKEGEERVLSSGARHAIIRYGYPFRASRYDLKLDFARNNIKLFDEGALYPMFDDQVYTVIFIDDLLEPMVRVIDGELAGIFHIASINTTTPFEFTSYLLEKVRGAKNAVKKGSMEEFLKVPGRTPRPRLGGLKTELTQQVLGIKFKTSKEMIDEFALQFKQDRA